jgi:predicted AlkP superfamily pyrophosphatase or phosphodiesterase
MSRDRNSWARTLFFGVVACNAIVVISLVAQVAGAEVEPDRHVVLITIDGFPASMYWDAKTPIPHLRNLATEGLAAEAMRVSNPTVTWPNHTTLLTGLRAEKHSVLFNGILQLPGPGLPVKVDPKRDKSELVAVPTLFDVLHEHGYRTAAIDWPCTRNSTAIDDDFPDTPDSLLYTTPRLRQELVDLHILPDQTDASFRNLTGPGRDDVWTKAACHVIEVRKPHLLVLHLLNTDGIHHRYGPRSAASYTALALADFYVGQVLQALDRAGIRAQTSVFVTADHGFASATNILHPNVLLRRAGLLELGASNQVTRARAQVVPEGGTGMVYLINPATRDQDRQAVLSLFNGQEGIGEIVEPSQFHARGLPSPETNPGMADLVLAAKGNYAIAGDAAGEAFVTHATLADNLGYHGYLATDPNMNAPFIAAGRGIQRAGKIGPFDNIDVASTIAHLLGIRFPSADGKVLTQILTPAD